MYPRVTLRVKLLALLSVGLATLALALVSGLKGEAEHAHAAGPVDIRSLLLTPNRDHLAICVQAIGDGGVATDGGRAEIQAILPEVAKHRYWAAAGLAAKPPAVASGCPEAPYLLQPGVAMRGAKDAGTAALPRVSTASPYRVFVFVMSEAQINALFGGSANRAAVQQVVCDGQHCGEVTTGLYLSPGELRDPQVLRGLIERAIGLEPRVQPQEFPGQR